MNKVRLTRLMHQYLNNTISDTDYTELLSYLEQADTEEIADASIIELMELNKGPRFSEPQAQDVLKRIQSDLRYKTLRSAPDSGQNKVFKLYKRRWFQIAAAFLLFFTGGIFFVVNKRNTSVKENEIALTPKAIILPGTTKASLTMANGKVIYLSNTANGMLAKVNSSNVMKTHNGQIVYHTASKTPADDKEVYNTLTTPKGGEYQVVLSDGTKVWLNAASSISYPVAFTGKDRHVKLTGEAYFEVAKSKKPFYVSINDVQVEDLGTHFNIEAYNDDDQIKATLLEGSVRVTKKTSHLLLKPGQQAVIGYNNNDIALTEANIDDVMAWKNGYFIFDNDNVTGIMKKVSRWYDVDISYKGNFDDEKFGGTFYRSKSITELLQHLEKVGKIHFTVEGRRIIVMN